MQCAGQKGECEGWGHGENDRIGWHVLLNDALDRFEISNAKN